MVSVCLPSDALLQHLLSYLGFSYLGRGISEYIMRNAGLEEAQAGIKIAGRDINNLRYTDDTTLTGESKEEQKSLLMKVKEESKKAGLKLNIQKIKIMTSGLISSVQSLSLTLCNTMDCSTPCFPALHRLPKLTQTYVHQVTDAIQPSHRLSSPSPPAPNPSQHQSLFQ